MEKPEEKMIKRKFKIGGSRHTVGKGRSNRNGRSKEGAIVTEKCAGVLNMNFNVSAGVVVMDIFPHAVGFCKRFSDMAYLFQLYRIVKFKYWILPTETRVSDEEFAHAVLPCDDGAPSLGSFGELVEIPGCKIFDARMVTSQENGVGFRKLVNQQSFWWSTTDSGNTKSDFVQAAFYCMSSKGAIANTAIWKYEFVVEFKQAAYDGESYRRQPHGKPRVVGSVTGKDAVFSGFTTVDADRVLYISSRGAKLRDERRSLPSQDTERVIVKYCSSCGKLRDSAPCSCHV